MKKLHVDRPDNIDDHREIDLLQRLAISWETTPEQLEVVVTEVDLWLRSRSDDSVSIGPCLSFDCRVLTKKSVYRIAQGASCIGQPPPTQR